MRESVFTGAKIPLRQPNCMKCAHFKIVWDPDFPGKSARVCDIFCIRCVHMPSLEVYRATGSHCPSFRLKDGVK